MARPILKGTQISINELILAFYLEPLGFHKIPQRSMKSIELGLKGKELDLYHPERKIAVEYDGEYVHKNSENDLEKNRLLTNLGITLYRFREPKCSAISGNCYILEESKTFSKSLESALKEFVCHILKEDGKKIHFRNDMEEIQNFIRKRKRSSLHLFEQNVMSNGMTGTVIAMRSCKDIDVEFEDGKVAYHKYYKSFKNGNIAHPDATSAAKKEQRLYQSKIGFDWMYQLWLLSWYYVAWKYQHYCSEDSKRRYSFVCTVSCSWRYGGCFWSEHSGIFFTTGWR